MSNSRPSHLCIFLICLCLGLLFTGCALSSLPAVNLTPVTTTSPPQLGARLFTYHGHTGKVNGIAWSPDGRRIASASDDGTVQVWDTFTGSKVLTYRGHTGPVHAVAWTFDRTHIASGGADTTVQVWDATTGTRTLAYRGHRGPVRTLAWSFAGTWIASGGDDMTVQVWQAG